MTRVNEFGQPIGDPVPDWAGASVPAEVTLDGRYVRVEPLTMAHLDELFEATGPSTDPSRWTYLAGEEQPADRAGMARGLEARLADPAFFSFAITPLSLGAVAGRASYMRIDPANGSIEIGAILYAASLARSAAATEAMYLLARHAFEDLGYRRYEWKCDSLNEPSRRAAVRLGFSYEGRFRNAMVYQGRNRDTDWFSITDTEWPAIKSGLEGWLAADNFDAEGRQEKKLRNFRAD